MNFKKRFWEVVNPKILLVLLGAGIILMLTGAGGEKENVLPESSISAPLIDEAELCSILESIEGAGRVRVFISYRDSGSEILAYDAQSSSDSEEKSSSLNVKLADNKPYTISRKTPEIQGILVTASGAGSNAVKKRIKESVSCATGVQPGKIHVEKAEE